MAEKKKISSAFQVAWYNNCQKHPDVHKLFFRECPSCLMEEQVETVRRHIAEAGTPEEAAQSIVDQFRLVPRHIVE